MHAPPAGAHLKRKHHEDDDLDTIAARRSKRPAQQLRLGSLRLPLNDAEKYGDALDKLRIYPVLPSDNSTLRMITWAHWTTRVIFGSCGANVIEGLLLDADTMIPWQIPKVTTEYKFIDYQARYQPYTCSLEAERELSLSPKTGVKSFLMV